MQTFYRTIFFSLISLISLIFFVFDKNDGNTFGYDFEMEGRDFPPKLSENHFF